MASPDAAELRADAPVGDWDRLELAVRRLLDERERSLSDAAALHARLRELESTLAEVSRGGLDPAALSAEVERMQGLNRALLARLERARGGVHGLLARLELLED